MTASSRKKFPTQVKSKTLAAARRVAKKKNRLGKPRSHVLAAYERSHGPYGELYRKLAR